MGAFFSRDLGIDLGTANTLVFQRGKGIVLREPSVVAVRNGDRREVLAVGEDARSMIGRTPGNIIAIRPLKDGVIADFDITEVMLKYFLRKALSRSVLFGFHPRVVICVPGGVTEVEKRAVEEAARSAGAREAHLLEEPMAAAIGAGLPVEDPMGSMIVDIGGGTTEVAVLSLGGLVTCRSLRVGGNHFDEAIIAYIRKEYNLMIGERMAEETKIAIGSAYAGDCEGEMDIRGRDVLLGLPQSLRVTGADIYEALREPVGAVVDAIRKTLERTPPELSGDIMRNGITLTGGSALLRGLPRLIAQETGMPVTLAADPLDCVVMGAGEALEEIHSLRSQYAPIPAGDYAG